MRWRRHESERPHHRQRTRISPRDFGQNFGWEPGGRVGLECPFLTSRKSTDRAGEGRKRRQNFTQARVGVGSAVGQSTNAGVQPRVTEHATWFGSLVADQSLELHANPLTDPATGSVLLVWKRKNPSRSQEVEPEP